MTEKKNNPLGVQLFLTIADFFIEKLLTDDEIKAAEKEYGSGRLKRSTNADYSKKNHFNCRCTLKPNSNVLDPDKEIKANYKAHDVEN